MTMIKYGIVDTDSHSDFDLAKKAEFYDAEGLNIADAANKDKLKKPVKIVDEKSDKQV